MNILLTGAFGNIGTSTLIELLPRGHRVRCFDLKTPVTETAAQKFSGNVEIVWGDLTKPEDVNAAMKDIDVVLHLAAIIPPLSEKNKELSRKVNVGGTKNILDAMKAQTAPPKLVFSSSIAIYGDTKRKTPPITVNDAPAPVEDYAHHKVECEEMIRASGLTWTVLRFAAAIPLNISTDIDPIMFDIALDTRIEFVHTRDVGLAVANAVTCEEARGKILIIGGGKKCQMSYREFVGKALESMGVGMLPDEAFGPVPFHTDWYDTDESQRLLKFQRHSYDDFLREMQQLLGFKRYLARVFRPLVRRMLLSKSPYYKKSNELKQKT